MRWLDALARSLSPGAEATMAERMAEAYEASSRGGRPRRRPANGSDSAIAPRSISKGRAWRRTIRERSRFIAPPPSMIWLGMIFHNALGVDRDPAQPASWWRRRAECGDADGQAMLGAAYHLGAGVKRTWLSRTHAGGSALAAGFLDAVRAGLSAQEIAAGERRAAAPVPEPSS